MKKYPLFLENVSGNFSINSMKKQDLMGVCTIFKLVIGLLILAILLIP